MRLEQGLGLPKQLHLLVIAHLLIVVALVIINVGIWVPADEGRVMVAKFSNALAALYILVISGVYLSASNANKVQDGTKKALILPICLALVAQFVFINTGVVLLWLANGWLMLLEATPSHKKRWPVPWVSARRQQGVLLLVALTSGFVALLTKGQYYG
ncbi:MAG TPA: hypothetical protein VK099_02225 [Alcanivoracaceae bacterium]|nr:hypothetical protein [Alcanivoracaceae bacterium]